LANIFLPANLIIWKQAKKSIIKLLY